MADSITSLVNETLPSGNSLTRAEVLDYIDVGRSPGGSEVSPSTGRDIRSEAAGPDWPTPARLCTQEAKLVFDRTRQNNVNQQYCLLCSVGLRLILPGVNARPCTVSAPPLWWCPRCPRVCHNCMCVDHARLAASASCICCPLLGLTMVCVCSFASSFSLPSLPQCWSAGNRPG